MSFPFYRHLRAALALFLLLAAVNPAKAEAYEETEKKHSWFSFSKPARKNPADQMAHAEELLRDRKASKAARAFRSLAITWPSSAEAPMAQWAYARILDQQGEIEDAFDAYQVLMEKFPGRFPEYGKVTARQFEIAKEIMTKRRGGFLLFGGFHAPERAVPYFEQIIKNGPRSDYAPEAQFLIGQAHEHAFEYDLAVMAYSAALHRYPESSFAEQSSLGRARSLFLISEDYPNDIKALEEAWAGVMVFMRAFPESKELAEASRMRDTLFERKAAADYDIAVYYDRIARKPQAARENYERVITFYPQSPKAELARKRLSELPEIEPSSDDGEEKTL